MTIHVPTRDLEITTARVFAPLLAPKRYKGSKGGRGSGKSRERAEALIEECLLVPGTRAVCIREYQKSLDGSVKQLLEDTIERWQLRNTFRVMDTEILTPGDGRIGFEGMRNHTADSIKSLEGYRIAFFEEAQNASQRSLDLLRPTLRLANSELWFVWNPRKPTDPVEKLFEGLPDNMRTLVHSTYADNPWFPDVLRADMEYDKRTDFEKYQHIWLGLHEKRASARVFKNWRVGDPTEFKPRANIPRLYYGGDFGFAQDPSVLIECYIEGRTLYISDEAYAIGCEIDHHPFLFAGIDDPKIKAKNYRAWVELTPDQRDVYSRGIPYCYEWPIIADSSRPETIAFLKRHGFPRIERSTKGAGSVEEGIEFLRNYEIVIHPKCVHTIDEFANFMYKVDPHTDEVLPVLIDKKNHTIDATRYAIEKLRRAQAGVL